MRYSGRAIAQIEIGLGHSIKQLRSLIRFYSSSLLLLDTTTFLLLTLVLLSFTPIPFLQTLHPHLANLRISQEEIVHVVRLNHGAQFDLFLVLFAIYGLCFAVCCPHEHWHGIGWVEVF